MRAFRALGAALNVIFRDVEFAGLYAYCWADAAMLPRERIRAAYAGRSSLNFQKRNIKKSTHGVRHDVLPRVRVPGVACQQRVGTTTNAKIERQNG